MAINMEVLKDEIKRTFRVLGADKGIDQNAVDINNWRDEGYITETEWRELRKYNRKVYSDLPLEF